MPSLMVYCLLMLFGLLSEGREILVGGKSNSWKVPESTTEETTTLNQWSQRTRFKIGDSLLWKYIAENDSVMQVKEKKDYERCDRSEPIRGYKDGHTKIELKRSGPYYFISGEKGHCQRGEKLLVVVLSPNHNKSVSAAPVNARIGDAVAPVKALVTNKGSDHSLNGAWSLVATACLLLLTQLVLLV